MERRELRCPKCGHAMIEGQVIDRTHLNAINRSVWIEGAIEFDGGYTTKPARGITAYRCSHCAYLETYADGEEIW